MQCELSGEARLGGETGLAVAEFDATGERRGAGRDALGQPASVEAELPAEQVENPGTHAGIGADLFESLAEKSLAVAEVEKHSHGQRLRLGGGREA